jgi:hypothetical protein
MTMGDPTQDPTRLRRAVASGSLEGSLLDAARSPGPTNAQCDEVWAGLALKVALGGAAAAARVPAGNAAASPGAAAAAKSLAATAATHAMGVLAGAALAASVAVGVAAPWRYPAAVSSAAPVLPVAPAAASPRPRADEREPAAAPAVTSAGSALPPSAPTRPALVAPADRARREARRAAIARVEADGLRDESDLLLRAQAALGDGDCSSALRSVNEARRRFPGGQLAPEREAMAVQALACAGDRDGASERAARFLRDYPSSPHADLVREFVR